MEEVSLDPGEFAAHRLTDEEWAQFDRDGSVQFVLYLYWGFVIYGTNQSYVWQSVRLQ